MANLIHGLHLIVDGRVDNPEVFDRAKLEILIRNLVQDLDMMLIFGPIFKEVPLDESKLSGDKFQDEGGTSGFAMINKSHISVHVWPLRRCFLLDICSCDEFDVGKALSTIHTLLKPVSIKVSQVHREQLLE